MNYYFSLLFSSLKWYNTTNKYVLQIDKKFLFGSFLILKLLVYSVNQRGTKTTSFRDCKFLSISFVFEISL